MAASETEIVNLALTLLGAELIESLDDSIGPAVLGKLVYPQARDGLLRAYAWRFAVRRGLLTAQAPEPGPAFGFAHAWQLPDACLRVLSIGREEPCGRPPPYSVEGNAVLTDETVPLPVRYIVRVVAVSEFDPHFVDLLVLRLAAALCERITGSTSKRESFKAEERALVREARRVGSMEHLPMPVQPTTDWLAARL